MKKEMVPRWGFGMDIKSKILVSLFGEDNL
jgi:hypothetical protein